MEINYNHPGQDPREKVEKNEGYRIRKYRKKSSENELISHVLGTTGFFNQGEIKKICTNLWLP